MNSNRLLSLFLSTFLISVPVYAADGTSATQPKRAIVVKVEGGAGFTAEMQKGLLVEATVFPNKDFPAVESFPIRYASSILIDFSDPFGKIKITEQDRRVVLKIDRSERCPYEGELVFNVSESVLKNPPTDLVLKLHPLELKKIVLALVDDVSGKVVSGQPIALMEESKESAVQVHEETTDGAGRVSFAVWGDRTYSVEPKIGGPVIEWSQFLKISPQILKDGKAEWKLKVGKLK